MAESHFDPHGITTFVQSLGKAIASLDHYFQPEPGGRPPSECLMSALAGELGRLQHTNELTGPQLHTCQLTWLLTVLQIKTGPEA
jgi:hypothetical protein